VGNLIYNRLFIVSLQPPATFAAMLRVWKLGATPATNLIQTRVHAAIDTPRCQTIASHNSRPVAVRMKMAGVAGLEPVTSAVTGQRSNQLSYTPAKGSWKIKKKSRSVKVWFGFAFRKISGQQTPRRWGWGTPLKKRAATRIESMLQRGEFLSTSYRSLDDGSLGRMRLMLYAGAIYP
jgi:hypothetical protein